MADVHDPVTRSRNMSAIRGKDTKPEVELRRGLFARKFRFRLHRNDLPGKPDMVLPKYNAVIHINGCFWHKHDCDLFKWPQTNREFWKEKIGRTCKRDRLNNEKLTEAGWRVMTVWECSLKGRNKLSPDDVCQRVEDWLLSDEPTGSIEGNRESRVKYRTKEEILADLKSSFSVPGGIEICTEAMREVLADHFDDKEWIKANFSKLVNDIQIAAYERYLALEAPAAGHALRKTFGYELRDSATADDLFSVLESNIWVLDRFFLGLTQGRRPRAGKAFEHIIKVLFDALGYPYTPQPIINGQPDFLLPSEEHYRRNAMDCIIFTVKRTLRERWRQITTEGTKGFMFFLATIDEKVATRDLPDMLAHRIYLVMPEDVRAKAYPDAANVISFETFFAQHLDPAMTRWRANGVI